MIRRPLTGYMMLILSVIWLLICQGTLHAQDKPSRENFFREVLYSKATKITPIFDDYTKGSYHNELPLKSKCETCDYPEWHYEILVADWFDGKTETLYGKMEDPAPAANVDLFLETLRQTFSKLDKIYPVEATNRNR